MRAWQDGLKPVPIIHKCRITESHFVAERNISVIHCFLLTPRLNHRRSAIAERRITVTGAMVESSGDHGDYQLLRYARQYWLHSVSWFKMVHRFSPPTPLHYVTNTNSAGDALSVRQITRACIHQYNDCSEMLMTTVPFTSNGSEIRWVYKASVRLPIHG
ncbi:hypothetical protein TNCV_2144031 [Trichonephila clavipes]|nr:hypothetical protein TNCV_2144031 [Trichonephila clavipes]